MAGQLDTLRKGWDLLRNIPGGKVIFSKLVGSTAPYTGTVKPQVLALERGFARVAMDDRPAVRNHLKSVHAIALANLVEVTGNLALAYSLPPASRFIVTRMEIDYIKKARGRLIGEARFEPFDSIDDKMRFDVDVIIRDQNGDVVVKGRCQSQVGPSR